MEVIIALAIFYLTLEVEDSVKKIVAAIENKRIEE